MLKLMKYELRKNFNILLGFTLLFIGFEGYFMGSYVLENIKHMGIATMLLTATACTCFFLVLLLSISNYSKEINSKTSYLIFMTPNSSLKIILSKLLYTLILGAVEAALIGSFAIIDIQMMLVKLDEQISFIEVVERLAMNLGIDMHNLWIGVLVAIIGTILNFFSIVSIAYMATTLVTTLLQNSKARNFISVVAFIAISVAVSFVDTKYIDNINLGSSMFLLILPSFIYSFVIVVAGVIGSAKLLDRGISL